MSKRHNEQALITCGCTFDTNGIPVIVDDWVICRSHGPQQVLNPSLQEFVVTCSNCTYQSAHRAARLKAEIAGAKHHSKKPTHTVSVIKPGGELHYVYKSTVTDTLGDW